MPAAAGESQVVVFGGQFATFSVIRAEVNYHVGSMSSGNDKKQTKAERQQAARDARQQAEQAEAAAAARKKRLSLLGGIAAAAAVIVAGIAIATSSGGDNADLTGTPNGASDVKSLFAGVPQSGNSAGKPDAPLTLVEFADLKCPVCRSFDVNAMPTIIQKYVQTGKLRIELRLLHFVGEQQHPGDSEQAARYAEAAGMQGHLWEFAEMFFFNQQDETTDYVNDKYLKWLSKPIAGLNADKALVDSKSKQVTDALDKYAKQFAANGFTGTPSFLLGTTGGTLAPLVAAGAGDKAESYTTQIDAALQGK